ncbi:MAG: serine/threonine-protein kinase [Deltaproteobacteria bacterium]
MSSGPRKLDPRIGTLVARRYRIQVALGEGGIGTVYRAEDERLRTRVAVKLLKDDLASDPTVLARFDREARAMMALAHENIVQALNFGPTPEGVVLVMELVEGETLRSTLNRLKPFPVLGAVQIASQIGAALVRAHAMGVVHRDLKPENVMVSWAADGRPRVKVLDFGMAKILGGTFGSPEALTKRGSVFGTPEYMPPEQAMGKPVDEHADQYAFGVMVFEMLAGKRPFSASSPLDMLQLQIHQAPPVLSDVMPSVPQEVSQIVLRMMAKKPTDRFPDVASAMGALQSVTVLAAQRASRPEPSLPPAGPPAGDAPPAADGAPRKWWQAFSGTKR